MSRMHAPDHNHLSETREAEDPETECPACGESMNSKNLPQHIAASHGAGSDD